MLYQNNSSILPKNDIYIKKTHTVNAFLNSIDVKQKYKIK